MQMILWDILNEISKAQLPLTYSMIMLGEASNFEARLMALQSN